MAGRFAAGCAAYLAGTLHTAVEHDQHSLSSFRGLDAYCLQATKCNSFSALSVAWESVMHDISLFLIGLGCDLYELPCRLGIGNVFSRANRHAVCLPMTPIRTQLRKTCSYEPSHDSSGLHAQLWRPHAAGTASDTN